MCSAGRPNLYLSTSLWCSAVSERAAWHGWSWGRSLFNHVLYYAVSLHGTQQYWFKQRSQLIAMVDTAGLPTIFFTHSAADLQWPELAPLICPDNPECSSSINKTVFFYHRIQRFVEAFCICWCHWCYRLLDTFWVTAPWQPARSWLGLAFRCS